MRSRELPIRAGVTKALIGNYAKHGDGSYALEFTFVLEAGEASRPRAPISGKSSIGPDQVIAVLEASRNQLLQPA